MPDDTTPTATDKPAKLSRGQIAALIAEEIPGLSKAGIEGVVRNVFRESGGNPKAYNPDYSGGLFQHHNSRFDELKAFAKAQGTDWQDPRAQVRFAATEMKKNYPTLLAQLQRADDPAEAEDSFKRVFERPKSIMWENNPRTSSPGYRFSDYALNEHQGRKGPIWSTWPRAITSTSRPRWRTSRGQAHPANRLGTRSRAATRSRRSRRWTSGTTARPRW